MERESSNCDRIRDLLPAYSIDAVDPEERSLVEQGLPDCPELYSELARYEALAQGMLHSAPQMNAPPHILDDLMAATAPAPRRTISLEGFLRPARLVAGLAILLLALTNLYWWTETRQLREDTAYLNQQLQLINAQSDVLNEQGNLLNFFGTGRTRQLTITAEDDYTPAASMVWGAGAAENTWVGVFSAQNLSATDYDREYQLWLVREADDALVNVGTFTANETGEGFLVFEIGEPFSRFERVFMTGALDDYATNPLSESILGAEF